jgi:hypothetical protein
VADLTETTQIRPTQTTTPGTVAPVPDAPSEQPGPTANWLGIIASLVGTIVTICGMAVPFFLSPDPKALFNPLSTTLLLFAAGYFISLILVLRHFTDSIRWYRNAHDHLRIQRSTDISLLGAREKEISTLQWSVEMLNNVNASTQKTLLTLQESNALQVQAVDMMKRNRIDVNQIYNKLTSDLRVLTSRVSVPIPASIMAQDIDKLIAECDELTDICDSGIRNLLSKTSAILEIQHTPEHIPCNLKILQPASTQLLIDPKRLGASFYVFTLYRYGKDSNRESWNSQTRYLVRENTALETLLNNPNMGCFLENDLKKRMFENGFVNPNPNWSKYYNSCILAPVWPIWGVTNKYLGKMLESDDIPWGFLCVDSEKAQFEPDLDIPIMQQMASFCSFLLAIGFQISQKKDELIRRKGG